MYFSWVRSKKTVRPEQSFFHVPLPNMMNWFSVLFLEGFSPEKKFSFKMKCPSSKHGEEEKHVKICKMMSYCFLKNKSFVDSTHKYIITFMEKIFTYNFILPFYIVTFPRNPLHILVKPSWILHVYSPTEIMICRKWRAISNFLEL